MTLSVDYNFSEPVIEQHGDFVNVYTDHADVYSIGDGRPILPVNLTILEFPFGTKILEVSFSHSEPVQQNLTKKLAYGSYSPTTAEYAPIYTMEELYPEDWVTYHKGGGLNADGERKTFLVIRTYPVRYIPADDKINYVQDVDINIAYEEPEKPILEEKDEYELLTVSYTHLTLPTN